MGTMKLPSVDNPYGVPVAISQPGGMQSEIITAPESPMSVRHAGEAMNKLSGDLRAAYDKWQLEIDKTRLDDLSTQLEHARIDLRVNPENGYETLKGVNALERPDGRSLNDEVSDAFKQRYEKLREQAGNARVRSAFDRLYQASSLKLNDQVNSYVTSQQLEYKDAVLKNQLSLALNQAADADPETAKSGLVAARSIAQQIGDFHGTPVDMIKVLGPIHELRVSNMIDAGQLSKAKAYISQHKAEMGPKAGLRLKSAMQMASDRATINRYTDEILKKDNGKARELLDNINAVPEKYRAAVKNKVYGAKREQEALEKATNYDNLNQAFQFVDNGEEVPASLMSTIKTNDRVGYEKIQRAIEHQKFPCTEDDPAVLGNLEELAETDPEEFAQTNFDQYRGYLTKQTIKTLKYNVEKLDDQQYKAFMAKVKQRCNDEKFNAKKTKNAVLSAQSLYAARTQQAEKNVLSNDTLNSMVNTVFEGQKPGFLFGYNDVSGADFRQEKKIDWEAVPQAGFRTKATEADRLSAVNNIRSRYFNLPPLQNLTKQQSQLIDARMGGMPINRELWERAYAEAKRQAKNNPRNPAVTRAAVELIALHMAFGEK
jgi:hypothetical protein|uniref:Putative lysin n=1 Tax=Siphoviridae sp. ctRg81 TaxID=2826336 RepID=A0A8S5NIA3_9CAUD|nr:MAG TPA: putative lysin [Siphoviridae sp. ctRg81]